MSILDLSKHLVYDFYYSQMKVQYGKRCHLLYTGTDSLLFEIQTEDVYKDMPKNKYLYDTSNYPKDHPIYIKDVCAERAIAEYVSLCPTMNSILEVGGKNIKKAKGVKTVKKHIRHEQYKEALFTKQTFCHGMEVLRSERHRICWQHT